MNGPTTPVPEQQAAVRQAAGAFCKDCGAELAPR